MVTLRLTGSPTAHHDGEVYSCAYTPDGSQVLSAGWDSELRLWETASGAPVSALRVGPKPLSACSVSPDGKQWLAGSMEGALSIWDALSQQMIYQSIVHTRPVSAICFSADGRVRATASWDRGLGIEVHGKDHDRKTLHGHEDIVAGCCFVPDGQTLLTWSHDRTVRLWNVELGRPGPVLQGHGDRVTAGAASPDGRWAATGSRNGQLMLWDLEQRAQMNTIKHPAEVRVCAFLLDGETLLTVDVDGRANVFSLPDLEHQGQLTLGLRVVCGALSPRGNQLAVGCEDGTVRLVELEGCDGRPRIVVATQTTRRSSTGLKWLFGGSTLKRVYETTCPACRKSLEVTDRLPAEPLPCPHCRSPLRFSKNVLMPQQVPC